MSLKKMLLLLLIPFSIYAQGDIENEENLRRKNKISEKLTYEFKSGAEDSILIDRDVYNEIGKHIKDFRYDENGNIRYNYIIEYNTDGMMIKQTGYDYGEISTVLTYKYDEKNNRIENLQHKPDGTLLTHQKRVYDNNNLNTELFNKNIKNNTFYSSYKYFYGDNNLYSRTERYNEAGEKLSITIYDYSEKDNSLVLYETEKKKKNRFLIKKYNDLTQQIEMVFLQSNKRIEYKYDVEGNLIEEIKFINDSIDSTLKYHYKKFSL